MSVAMTETKVHVGDETISESKEANDAFAVPGAVHGGDATGSSPTTATTGRQVTAASPRGLCCKRWCNKGAVSNYITACFMVLGIALCAAFPTSVPCRYVLSFGLFGFAGGVTNWLAILMLFDRVPFLIGSGVIPRRFKEIRATVKETIMDTFFDKEYLEAYLQERAKGVMSSLDLGGRIKKALEADDVDALMVQKLEEVRLGGNGAAAGAVGTAEEEVVCGCVCRRVGVLVRVRVRVVPVCVCVGAVGVKGCYTRQRQALVCRGDVLGFLSHIC